jgi:hypothetical protein
VLSDLCAWHRPSFPHSARFRSWRRSFVLVYTVHSHDSATTKSSKSQGSPNRLSYLSHAAHHVACKKSFRTMQVRAATITESGLVCLGSESRPRPLLGPAVLPMGMAEQARCGLEKGCASGRFEGSRPRRGRWTQLLRNVEFLSRISPFHSSHY